MLMDILSLWINLSTINGSLIYYVTSLRDLQGGVALMSLMTVTLSKSISHV